jgi:hypothetical protein
VQHLIRVWDGHRYVPAAPRLYAGGRWTGGTRTHPDDGVVLRSPFAPYLAAGTVFTRDVADMPLATRSADYAAWMAASSPWRPGGAWGARTSLNTGTYNIPIHLVDSRLGGLRRVRMTCRGVSGPGAAYLNGPVPWPVWARPAPSGDRSIAIYDLGTGIMREFFLCTQVDDDTWTAASGGYHLAEPDLAHLATTNYAMRLTQGSSSVVRMLNPLSQIGVTEARNGRIGHALSVTMANAASPTSTAEGLAPDGSRVPVTGASWPAQSGDGDTDGDVAPIHGQWFRLPQGIDVAAYRPFTRVLIAACQTYGGYGADTNDWCHAFNAEPGTLEEHLYGVDPWSPQGDVHARYARACRREGYAESEALDVSDFPWELTEWAPRDWGRPVTPVNRM